MILSPIQVTSLEEKKKKKRMFKKKVPLSALVKVQECTAADDKQGRRELERFFPMQLSQLTIY